MSVWYRGWCWNPLGGGGSGVYRQLILHLFLPSLPPYASLSLGENLELWMIQPPSVSAFQCKGWLFCLLLLGLFACGVFLSLFLFGFCWPARYTCVCPCCVYICVVFMYMYTQHTHHTTKECSQPFTEAHNGNEVLSEWGSGVGWDFLIF